MRRMETALYRYLFAPLALLAAPVSAQAPAGDLAAVATSLRTTQSLTAAFVQTDRQGKALSGTLTLKKPGKIRFQYQKGVPVLIVGDGRALYFIDYSVRQVSRWPIGNSPLGVLIDPDRNIARFAKIVPSGDPRIVSVDAADAKHPEYGRINLVFARDASAPGGLMLQGWVARDAQGNRTSVRLSNQRFNVPVADNSFRWTDPRRTSPRS